MMPPPFTHRYARVLIIAGSDSGGGAGIQADLKAVAALGAYGMTAITALTAQNTLGVRAIHGVPPAMLRAQIDAVAEDIGADAVKIGMLHAPDIVHAVADALDAHRLAPVVLDPVMISTSGSRLLQDDAVQALVAELFPRAALVTPNLDEAGFLTGRRLDDEAGMAAAADELLARGAPAVLLKGGHLPGDEVADLLATRAGGRRWLRAPRIASANTHGTGCTLSSAIAARLALGDTLDAAVQAAHAYVRRALAAGAAVRTGAGSGPLNHGAAPERMRLIAL
ncbi:bifunctional hydroxymethylpyrimidine kinase/phosphomethylpyrimidine kinase [Rubrivivax sp. JA1026]|uniref:bifunctional hydroxymethylpyrimidine kinase/phosphomethylpyrimidine kinase n=1 Tax=Rubrivivax sp. JA1026 TaxID=2710888 RepID=UPI0013E97581|nr:bifunctional hydroxymethylpyrimidine kinase/phosphomethylpyrimidine kinase [Rubrivivax sp. JA1026]